MHNSFFCIEILNYDNSITKFYVLGKTENQNIAKMLFLECLVALEIQLSDLYYNEPFYPKKFFGKVDFYLFNQFVAYLKRNPKTTKAMLDFLLCLEHPSTHQTKDNYEKFRELYYVFLKDYILNYEKEWHPAGLKNEINFLKKNITKKDVCILAINEYALRVLKKL